ncbi:hypothetical protein KJ765_00975 [Candidatus Micrarchaeota archaeon]|nr:hypothetical protein [Candidatus Micrarchaeota archaeon]
MPLNPEVKKAFDKVHAKLELLNKGQEESKEKLFDLAEFDEKVEKVVEEKVLEIKGVAYMILIIVAILLAIVLGALLRLYFGE